MMRYKRCAVVGGCFGYLFRYPTGSEPAEKPKVEGPIHPGLNGILDSLGSLGFVDPESQNLIKTMAVGLTRWIKEEDGSTEESKVEASERILNCYLAQLQEKTDTTATYLDLVNFGFKILPPEIGMLTRLTGLFLSNNKLTTFPPEIGGLTSLTDLFLDNNQLAILPAEIGGLTRLGRLYLHDNQLKTLPTEIGRLTRLTWLILRNNELTTLPAEIGVLTTLERLGLSNNYLTEAARANLPEYMRALETGLDDQNGAKELQKDLEKNRAQIASRREKILGCENVRREKWGRIKALERVNAIGYFKGFPRDLICKMMTEFMDSDDMKRMRVTAKEMKKTGSMMEEFITLGKILKDHEREKARLEQSIVHLQGIAKNRGWDL